MANIAEIELLRLSVPEELRQPESAGLDDVTLLRLTDELGRQGLGEVGAPFDVAAALARSPITTSWTSDSEHVSSGALTLCDALMGRDPVDREGIWDRMYAALPINARRGISIALLSGIDLAVHDLAGKQLGVTVHDLLGGAVRVDVRPYATVWAGVREGLSPDEVIASMLRKVSLAVEEGYRAVKVEMLFGSAMGDDELVCSIERVRRSIDPSIALAIDFGYRWIDWRPAAAALARLEDVELLFAEAVLPHDDIASHAHLCEQLTVPICGAEFAVTRWEVQEWIDRGQVDIVQPGLTTGGGLSELARIAALCAATGTSLIPHGWVGGVGAVAQRHLQLACAAIPYVEDAPDSIYGAPLRSALIGPTPGLSDGAASPPIGPGLGLDVDDDLVRRFLRDHQRLA
jgi:L-rhamnonate dehydratase